MSVTKMIALKLLKWQIRVREWWFWDREDYLAEAESQLFDPGVYEELTGDFENPSLKL